MSGGSLHAAALLALLLAAGCLTVPAPPSPDDPGHDPGADGADGAPGAPPVEEECQVLVQDSFDGPALDSERWFQDDAGVGRVVHDPPRVRLDVDGDGDGLDDFAALGSQLQRPVAGTRLTARLSADATEGEVGLELNDGEGSLGMMVRDGQFHVEHAGTGFQDAVCDRCRAYDPAQHVYWRLRAEGGTVHAEISADAVEWDQLGSMADPGGDHRAVAYAVAGGWDDARAQLDEMEWSACAEP